MNRLDQTLDMVGRVDARRLPEATSFSFNRSSCAFVLDRLKLTFAAGFSISLVLYFIKVLLLPMSVADATPLFKYAQHLFAGHAVLFAAGLGALMVGKWTWRKLMLLDASVMIANLILASLALLAIQPSVTPYFAFALILFLHAAFVPCSIKMQSTLAIAALCSYLAAQLTGFYGFEVVRSFWLGNGGEVVFAAHVLMVSFCTIVLGVASVLVTRTLYSMRKNLRRAERFGNYIIEDLIGAGGMGRVYRAAHALLCRPTAIKILKFKDSSDVLASIENFEREVRLAANLSHPNTVTIYDFGRTNNNTFFYAMEYLDGMDLQRLVERFGPVDSERAIHILKQVCGSLEEAHKKGIVHGDIKPSNIIVTNRGGIYDFVKVVDFGLAKEIIAKPDETEPVDIKKLSVMGTPRYIAPETVFKAKSVDGRADLYNLGAVAYWMLTGQPLFASSSDVDLVVDHLKTPPSKPSSVTELPILPQLESIIMRCLAKDPSDRFQSAEEVETALSKIESMMVWDESRAKDWWELHEPQDDDSDEAFVDPALEHLH